MLWGNIIKGLIKSNKKYVDLIFILNSTPMLAADL